MRKIQFLNLYFPHGATVKECDEIAQNTQDIVMAGVSEGGMTPTNKYGLNVDDVTFSEESMSYTFGHNRNQEGKCPPHDWSKDGERCAKCGIKDWMT